MPGHFPGGHAHTAESLADELTQAGFADVEVLALEGAAGLALEALLDAEAPLLDAAMTLAQRLEATPGVRDVSNHLIAFGRRP